MEQLIDLSESSLTPSIKEEFYELLEEYKKYFSLYDELGLVQRMEINLEFIDNCQYKGYEIKDREKDENKDNKDMNKLVILGIIKK